ncbi:unnamed protein product [Chrysoparadoxa australica]
MGGAELGPPSSPVISYELRLQELINKHLAAAGDVNPLPFHTPHRQEQQPPEEKEGLVVEDLTPARASALVWTEEMSMRRGTTAERAGATADANFGGSGTPSLEDMNAIDAAVSRSIVSIILKAGRGVEDGSPSSKSTGFGNLTGSGGGGTHDDLAPSHHLPPYAAIAIAPETRRSSLPAATRLSTNSSRQPSPSPKHHQRNNSGSSSSLLFPFAATNSHGQQQHEAGVEGQPQQPGGYGPGGLLTSGEGAKARVACVHALVNQLKKANSEKEMLLMELEVLKHELISQAPTHTPGQPRRRSRGSLGSSSSVSSIRAAANSVGMHGGRSSIPHDIDIAAELDQLERRLSGVSGVTAASGRSIGVEQRASGRKERFKRTGALFMRSCFRNIFRRHLLKQVWRQWLAAVELHRSCLGSTPETGQTPQGPDQGKGGRKKKDDLWAHRRDLLRSFATAPLPSSHSSTTQHPVMSRSVGAPPPSHSHNTSPMYAMSRSAPMTPHSARSALNRHREPKSGRSPASSPWHSGPRRVRARSFSTGPPGGAGRRTETGRRTPTLVRNKQTGRYAYALNFRYLAPTVSSAKKVSPKKAEFFRSHYHRPQQQQQQRRPRYTTEGSGSHPKAVSA